MIRLKVGYALLSGIGAVLVISISLTTLQSFSATPLYSFNVLHFYLALWNLIIVSAALALSWMGALAALLVSAATIIVYANSIHQAGLLLHILPGILSAVLGIRLWGTLNEAFARHTTDTESVLEESNLLRQELSVLRGHISGLEKKILRYSSLKDITESVGLNLSVAQTASNIVRIAFDTIGKSHYCLLFLVDEERQALSLVASLQRDGYVPIKTKAGDIYDHWALKQRKPLLVADTSQDFRFRQFETDKSARRFNSLLCAPLSTAGRTIGLLRLDSSNPGTYQADDLRLLDILSDLAAMALHNAMLYEKTEELAITDSLTGLYVHKYFKQRLAEEVIRAARSQLHFSLLLLDLDHFKKYNDIYGHIAGDIILRRVAALIQKKTAPGDIAARYGGEEFGVILVEADRAQAQGRAEEIRRCIENEVFLLRRQESRITISGGVVVFPDDARVPEDMIREADKQLYRAKQAGRNQICLK